MTDAQLIQRICQTALLHGQFTLRSGRTSHYYLDKYLFQTEPDVLAALAKRFATHVDEKVNRLAGAQLGGIPLVTATSLASGKPAVLIRSEAKVYGTANQIEGVLKRNDRVLLLEDVVTSGGQVLEAAALIAEAGAQVVKIVAAIDREEGGRQRIEDAGYTFASLITRTDLGIK